MKKLLFIVFFAMLTFIAKADGVVQVPVRKSSIDIKATHGHIRHAPLKNWCPIVETMVTIFILAPFQLVLVSIYR